MVYQTLSIGLNYRAAQGDTSEEAPPFIVDWMPIYRHAHRVHRDCKRRNGVRWYPRALVFVDCAYRRNNTQGQAVVSDIAVYAGCVWCSRFVEAHALRKIGEVNEMLAPRQSP